MGLTVALVNDYEVVVRGVASMLRAYRDRIRVAELDLNTGVGQSVDIALYDTFASTQGDQHDVHDLAVNPRVSKVVVYSWNVREELVRATFTNGVSGYVSKGLTAHELVGALERIAHGEPGPYSAATSLRAISSGDWPGREEGLTPREAEVLALITQGMSNDEIASRTHLSINSVKSYIRSCYRRIGATSRTQAVLWGVDHGFKPDRLRITSPSSIQNATGKG